jgi:hypothetical protein
MWTEDFYIRICLGLGLDGSKKNVASLKSEMHRLIEGKYGGELPEMNQQRIGYVW